MHRRPVLPLGVKFDPTDVELILGYLGPKVRGERLAWDVINLSDLVYTKPPWEVCSDLTTFPGHEKHYFFTELEKNKNVSQKKKKEKNKNRAVRTVGSYGTWHSIYCKGISVGSNNNNNNNNNNNGIIGFNRLFNFKTGENKETTDWSMHELSLPDKEINLVLCVIQKKNKKKNEEMGSAYDKFLEFDPMFCLVRDSTTSAGGDPSPAPAPSKKMRSDPKFDDDPSSGGDPCPATAHGDHFELQALDSEVQQTQPDDNPFPDASCIPEISSETWESASQGFSDKNFDLPPDDAFFDFQIPPFFGDSGRC